MQIFSKPFKLLFHTSHFWQMLSGTISCQPCMTWHKPWREPSPLQEKWTCQPKRIISWTYNRKHAWSCHWLIFQINLELYYIILNIPENPQCSFNGRLPVKSLSFAPFLLDTSEIWNNISFLFLMNFVYLNPPFLHRSLTSWISVRASFMMVLILAHHPHKNFSGGY